MSAEDSIRWLPVREVGEVRMGKQLSPASRANGTQLPYLRVANVYEGRITYEDVKSMGFSVAEQEVYKLLPGDVLLNEGQENLGMVGRSAIYEGEPGAYRFQNTLIRFRPGPHVLPDYAQAIFVDWRRRGVFARVAEKTSISHLGGSRFAKILFPLRSRSDQQRIVEVLAAFAAEVRATEEAIVKLRTVRQGVLLSAIPSGTQRLAVPGVKSVQWLAVRDVGEVRMGKQLSPASREFGTRLPYLRVANVLDGWINYSDVNEMGFSDTEQRTYRLLTGDILLNEGQSLELVGRSAIYRRGAGKFFFQNTLVRFRAGEGLLPEYAHAVFSYWLTTGVFAAIAKKTTSIAHLGGDRFAGLPFPLVPLEEQQRVVSALAAWDKRIASEEEALRKIGSLKHGLVDDLLSGKVRMRDVA
ncbi:restriction endonuclease subunit S [Streptomyces phaeochromogenes]|uniref:restriction endonuclease subunit S n=1 Tax=Streptomyces phaeochromogenes TaxID=1923 RepID=UPI0036B8C9E8